MCKKFKNNFIQKSEKGCNITAYSENAVNIEIVDVKPEETYIGKLT